MLALLALAAGCVDAVSFLALGRVLTAAMTGNTLLLGIAAGQADAAAALRALTALAGFLAGAVLGAAIVERGPRTVVWSPEVTVALALELVILIALALAWPVAGDVRLLIIAAGLAMGIQSAAALRIGVPGVATTYVTGTLMSLSARLVRWLRTARQPLRDRGAGWLAAIPGAARWSPRGRLWWPRAALAVASPGRRSRCCCRSS